MLGADLRAEDRAVGVADPDDFLPTCRNGELGG